MVIFIQQGSSKAGRRRLDCAAQEQILAAERDRVKKWEARRTSDTLARALRRPRRHSSVEALIVVLPAHPIITVSTGQNLLGRSKQPVNDAIALLVESGVLRPLTLARRNRAWKARDLFHLIDDVEHELAAPDDTEPCRPSPSSKNTVDKRGATRLDGR
jgi:hypothetical protein